MSMTQGFGRVVLLLGHGAQVTNNPHESAYHCGACGGHTGEVSARLLASLLNDPEARAGLSDHGVDLPEDTVFVAGLHDTTTDDVRLYPDGNHAAHVLTLSQIRNWLHAAGALARAERAIRLPGASAGTVAARAQNWAEMRPEWGLGRLRRLHRRTARRDCGGRPAAGGRSCTATTGRPTRNSATLELILTAPVVVASWISLQYYGSSVAPGSLRGWQQADPQRRGRHRRHRRQWRAAAPRSAVAGGP